MAAIEMALKQDLNYTFIQDLRDSILDQMHSYSSALDQECQTHFGSDAAYSLIKCQVGRTSTIIT